VAPPWTTIGVAQAHKKTDAIERPLALDSIGLLVN